MATESGTVFCRDCGEEITARAEICPECGVRQKEPPKSDKSEGLAAVLSFVIPGLGQVYNGQLAKGIILGVITIGLALTGVGLLLAVPIWIWLVYDAYKTPGKSDIDDQVELPEDAMSVTEAIEHVLEWHEEQGDNPEKAEEIKGRLESVGFGGLQDGEIDFVLKTTDQYDSEVGEIETSHVWRALTE